MSSLDHPSSLPILEMDGHQWDVSNLSGSTDTDTLRKGISAVSSGPSATQANSSEGQSSKLSQSSNTIELLNNYDGANYAPTHLSDIVMMAENSVEEYEGVPTYPSLSDIPACLDVDDIFEKVRVSKSALNGGNVLHQVRRLSPSRYLRTSMHSHDSPAPLPPNSSNMDHQRQFGGSGGRLNRVQDGREKDRLQQQQQQQRPPRQIDEFGRHVGHLQDHQSAHQLSERSFGASTPHHQNRSHHLHQYQPRDVIGRDFPTVEVVVPTVRRARSEIPADVHDQRQQRHPEDRFRGYSTDRTPDDRSSYLMRDGQDPYHRHQRLNPYDVYPHRESQLDEEWSNSHGFVQPSSDSRHSNESSVVSGISNDRLSTASDREYPQQQETRYSSDDDRLVEVIPGTYVKLRGSVETWEAIQMGRTIRSACLSCTVILLCIHDADMVMCPVCKSISPVERDGFGGGGLGLGMSEEEAAMELRRLVGYRAA